MDIANKAVNVYRFYGLNRTRKGARGEMEDMTNMSSSEYPCAAPAPSREAVAVTDADILTAAAPDSSVSERVAGLTGVAGGSFYYNGVNKSGRTVLNTSYDWRIARQRNLYIISGAGASGKDLFVYNIDTDAFTNLITTMDKLIVTAGVDTYGSYLETIRYEFSAVFYNAAALPDGSTMYGYEFYDKYSSVSESDNIFEKYFNIGDELEISGFPKNRDGGRLWYYNGGTGDNGDVVPASNYDVSVNNTVDKSLYHLSDIDRDAIVLARVKRFSVINSAGKHGHRIYFELTDKAGNGIEFKSMLSKGASGANYYAQGVVLKLACPAFSDIAVHNERLWGAAVNGESIYASSAADISDFTPASLAADYAARLVPDIPGPFTGLAEYGSYLLAFKENAVILIYGSNVKGYICETIRGIGCIDKNSIAVTHSGVIFLSYNGFYIYDGSAPRLISSKLNTRYTEAVAGFDGNLYYASAQRDDGGCELLSYDMRYGLWHVRDSFHAAGMFPFRGGFYFAASRGIYKESGTPGEWSFTLARTTDNTLDNKAVNELWIYAEVAEGAYFTVATSAGNDDFIDHAVFREPGHNVYRCPVRVRGGAHYRIRLTGAGRVVFYEIEIRKGAMTSRRYKDFAETVPAVINEGI